MVQSGDKHEDNQVDSVGDNPVDSLEDIIPRRRDNPKSLIDKGLDQSKILTELFLYFLLRELLCLGLARD